MKRHICRLAVLAAALLSGACAFVDANMSKPLKPLEETVLEGEGKPKILIVDVSGIISEIEREGGAFSKEKPSTVARVKEALRKAEKDDNVAAVIIRINSPGGTVTASDIIHHEIKGFKERKKVPVHACIVGLGASGGYYVASAADRIIILPTAVTGSIGVIVQSFNVEGLISKIGVTEIAIKSGDKKDIMSPFREMTPEERQLIQGIIDSLYGRFLDVVIARPGGKLDREGLKKLADGRVFTADQALAAGLVDRTGYLDDVITDMKKELKLEEARVVTYYRPGSFKGTIYSGEVTWGAPAMGLINIDLPEMFYSTEFLYLWKP